jgi:hypothetical protein
MMPGRDYAAGLSPKAIAKRLNAERITPPGRTVWNPSTIHGNRNRGTGILNNELYVGRMIWNRLRYLKDPDSGKRVSRLNPAPEWIATEVPQLRIVEDELWNQVKARQAAVRALTDGQQTHFKRARRPKFLFSGLAKCAECGGGYVMFWRDRLACFNARSRGTCTNRRTISREEIESRVLVALRDKLMRRDLFEEFCREYVKELNRLRMEHRAKVSQRRHELAVVEREIRKLVQAIKDGVSATSIKRRCWSSRPDKSICRRSSKPLRCRSSSTREWRTSTAKRSARCAKRWSTKRAALARRPRSAG